MTMWWFKRTSRKSPQEIQVPQVRFLGEQSGPPERKLKEKLTEFFWLDKKVKTAYLASVIYDDQFSIGVALCLITEAGPDRDLVEKIGRIFAAIFGRHEHLDIIFLSDGQESELIKVCPPFWKSRGQSC